MTPGLARAPTLILRHKLSQIAQIFPNLVKFQPLAEKEIITGAGLEYDEAGSRAVCDLAFK